MATLIGSTEAASILDVSKPTLYAYVSRGRLTRTVGPDGRRSLFDRDEVQALAHRSHRPSSRPRSTIDVVVSSSVTEIDESGSRFRGHDVAALAEIASFEDVAELLWTGQLPSATPMVWPSFSLSDRAVMKSCADLPASPLGRMVAAASVLGRQHPDDGPADAARRLLLAVPSVFGSSRQTGRYARRLVSAWRARPARTLVDAIDAALVLLADHELATNTMIVRIAASLRAFPYAAFAAGLAGMDGATFGSVATDVHRFVGECDEGEPTAVIERWLSTGRSLPGFGHPVYRRVDPRFAPLLERVRRLDPAVAELVEVIVADAGRVTSRPPNIDLALGALTYSARLDPSIPIPAIARIAGWGAHYGEEAGERPMRFRGVAAAR